MARLELDLAETKGGRLLGDWLRYHARDIEKDAAASPVSDDLRTLAAAIDAAYLDEGQP